MTTVNINTKKPLISIITVCYNASKSIEQTMQSVLKQEFTDYEYIIIDGGSIDGTIDLIKKYVCLFDNRMHYVSEPDNGIYDAMNKGIKLSTGTLICMLNSDDWLTENALLIIEKNYDGGNTEILYGMARIITDNKEERVVLYNHEFLNHHMINHQAAYVTKDIFDSIGGFSLDYKSVSDYDFMLRAQKIKNIKFIPIYEILVNFRSGGMSFSASAMIESAKLRYHYHFIGKFQLFLGYLKAFLVSAGVYHPHES